MTVPAEDRSASQTSPIAFAGDGPLLTVIVPAYNEQRTIGELLALVLAVPCNKQVIVVDDCSTDGTASALQAWRERGVQVVLHPKNRGKGAAIRTGLAHAQGHFTIIQDADLEYDPADYLHVIRPLVEGRAQVVYGSRYLQADRRAGKGDLFRHGVSLLNWAVRILYGAKLTDEATCYKALPTALLREMDLQCERFEFCPEVTAKICRMGLPILEVPISYRPRSASEGKKIRYRDGLQALGTLWRWRKWKTPATKLS